MIWTETYYPDKMKDLPLPVRKKAIEIANALKLEKKMEEDALIELAISQALDWMKADGKGKDDVEKKAISKLSGRNDEHYVIPYGEREWAVKESGKKKVVYVFHTKKKAIELATSQAKKANSALTIQKRSGKVEKRISFNPERRRKRGAASTGKI